MSRPRVLGIRGPGQTVALPTAWGGCGAGVDWGLPVGNTKMVVAEVGVRAELEEEEED